MPEDRNDFDSRDETHRERAADSARSRRTPERIGAYRILDELGEGGFGVVYLAEQTQPIRRRVALKIIKPGMDTEAVIARFEAERQALALMDHANIAHVFDAGVTNAELGSRPYFVMEYVAGVPVTAHCDRQRLTIDERIELFIKVCAAIQHAHQKGIIHRDIKPSNILVDASGEPKVIDFGVAKALNQRLTERTLFTEFGQFIGTPEYMSPEQAEATAQDIDTRSDIYSLGVLLYELLTGSLPFDPRSLRRAALHEIQRIIREVEPPKPSTRVTSHHDAVEPVPVGDPVSSSNRSSSNPSSTDRASTRRTDLRTLRRSLRGDLDWIVMRCLEKDRNRRYPSASELAADLRRHLRNEPVLAGPPSVSYRMRKFLKRHRAAALAIATVAPLVLIVAALVAGLTAARVNQRQIDAHESVIASVQANRPFESLPVHDIILISQAADDLAASLDGAGSAILRETRESLQAYRTSRLDEVQRLTARSADEGRDPWSRYRDRRLAVDEFLNLRAVFPNDEDLIALASSLALSYALSVQATDERGDPIDATVYLRSLDDPTGTPGAAERLGRAPLSDAEIGAGYYRIVVAFDAGGAREFARYFDVFSPRHELNAIRRDDESTIETDMVAFDGGAYALPSLEFDLFYNGLKTTLEPFQIDRYEVTNAQYRAFVDATERTQPIFWREFGYPSGYDDHPISGISWLDARAYAEWAGKRLPTLAEWLFVASGREHRQFPYTNPSSDPPLRGVVNAPLQSSLKMSDQWSEYLQRTAAARSHPDASSPEGIHHLFGNVEEWTETIAFNVYSSELLPSPFDRIYLGGAWDAIARSRWMTWYGQFETSDLHRPLNIGFRCARSVDPPD